MNELTLAFEKDDRVGCLLFRSSLEKSFCAGGDIISLAKQRLSTDYTPVDSADPSCTSAEVSSGLASFFRLEYGFFLTLSELSKPSISLMRGIVFGGGAGLSMACTYRIATDNTTFSMPETAIGLFPDVGASYFLTKTHPALGRYLGVTGSRLTGADMARLGYATHYTPLHNVKSIVTTLRTVCMQLGQVSGLGDCLPRSVLRRILVDGLLGMCVVPSPHRAYSAVSASELCSTQTHTLPPLSDKSIIRQLPLIELVFQHTSMSRVCEVLTQWTTSDDKHCVAFATRTLQTLAQMSPLSVVLTYQLMTHSVASFKHWACLEYNAILRVARGDFGNKDLVAGVDAKLISKHFKPVWTDWEALVQTHAHRLPTVPVTVEEKEQALKALMMLPLTGHGHPEQGLLDGHSKL